MCIVGLFFLTKDNARMNESEMAALKVKDKVDRFDSGCSFKPPLTLLFDLWKRPVLSFVGVGKDAGKF